MTYQKPEVVLNGTAISAIEVGLNKGIENEDTDNVHSVTAYGSDE